VDPARDHIRGPEDAPVTLVEYGDYQCPYCGQAEVVIRELLDDFGDELRYVWRHLPLSDVHANAQMAAEAAEAAGAQGSYWGMHDVLFENQQALEDPHLLVYAKALGLDLRQFAADLDSHAHLPKVREDFFSGVRSGVSGTPTFFVNGVRHDGPWDLASLVGALENASARLEA
jgi:protein-disulfide isomerase